MKRTITAYCFASGHIDFGATLPEGAIALATGEEKQSATSSPEMLLCPGMTTKRCLFQVCQRPRTSAKA